MKKLTNPLVGGTTDPLNLDALVARMNTPAAKTAYDALFKATPSELGAAAVKAAGEAPKPRNKKRGQTHGPTSPRGIAQ